MADVKNDPKNKPDHTSEEIEDQEMRILMGPRFKDAVRLKPDLDPPKSQTPQPIQPLPRSGTGKGMAPPFPIVPPSQLANFKEIKDDPKEKQITFAAQQLGKFDKELNELALQEVAESKGLTVDQLLKSQPDKKLEQKLDAIEVGQEQAVEKTFDASSLKEQIEQQVKGNPTADEARIEDLKNQIAAIEKSKAEAAEAEKQKPKVQTLLPKKEEPVGIPKELQDNPVLRKLREKLGQPANTCDVTVEGVEFQLTPPPGAMTLWVLEKIQAAQEFSGAGLPQHLTIKIATVSAALMTIEKTSIAEVLGVQAYGTKANPHLMDLDTRLVVSQMLWEMFCGIVTVPHLFPFHPDLAIKLYDAFVAKFGSQVLESSMDGNIHRYVCPIEDCQQMYDQTIPPDGNFVYCKVHGTPMEDKGLTKDLRSLPLA